MLALAVAGVVEHRPWPPSPKCRPRRKPSTAPCRSCPWPGQGRAQRKRPQLWGPARMETAPAAPPGSKRARIEPNQAHSHPPILRRVCGPSSGLNGKSVARGVASRRIIGILGLLRKSACQPHGMAFRMSRRDRMFIVGEIGWRAVLDESSRPRMRRTQATVARRNQKHIMVPKRKRPTAAFGST
jgi:hypothetical protein